MTEIAILAGELSGDMSGGSLARALRAACPDIRLWGTGSSRMSESGMELLFDCAEWGSIGIMEALKVYPRLRYSVYPTVLKTIANRKPDLVILIDFGAFNVRVAKWCRARNIKTLYYFPPGSWRRSGNKGMELASIVDHIATPFPWSADRFRESGANVDFVGHPLLEICAPVMSRAQFCERFALNPDKPLIGLLPGSRNFEIQYNTPTIINTARLIYKQMPQTQFVFAAASENAREKIEHAIRISRDSLVPGNKQEQKDRAPRQRAVTTPEGFTLTGKALQEIEKVRRAPIHENHFEPAFPVTRGLTWDVIAHSDAILVCSGTATLEAAILQTPMVILYRGSSVMQIERKLRHIAPEHIGMPNIIAQKRVVPEFIQEDATPEVLAASLLNYLQNPAEHKRVKKELAEIYHALGTPGASDRTAKIAMDMIKKSITG
jgi:lipid-A-disaccharide synthase